jgi:hypothetical protein
MAERLVFWGKHKPGALDLSLSSASAASMACFEWIHGTRGAAYQQHALPSELDLVLENNVTLVIKLVEERQIAPDQAFVLACQCGRVSILHQLLQTFTESKNRLFDVREGLRAAVRAGQLSVLEYFWDKPEHINKWDPSIFDEAARVGQMAVLKWLHEREANASTNAMYGVRAIHISVGCAYTHHLQC